MNRDEAMAKLQQVFDDVFVQNVRLTDKLSAADVREWDSLSHITLVVATEKAFGIKFRVGEVESTNNVGEFVDLILRRLGKA